jgi:methylase of polypeptide subunit release factors
VTAAVSTAKPRRAAFDRAGYDEERIAAALHVEPPVGAFTAAANRGRLHDDALGRLVRLFLVGDRMPIRTFEEDELADALELDLVRRLDGDVEAPVAVVPFRGDLVVHDHEGRPVERSDHVAGVGPSTRTLAALTVRRRARRALDIGTGNGAQALQLARHADEVVATDINSRALSLASTTLRLNDVGNVELREGSFFEPVAGERFDVIATNPPWVVSPDSAFMYRDTAYGRDEVSKLFVQTLPEHLTDGGIATTLACWLHADDEDWSAPVRDWLAGRGCDAVVVRYASDDPISYANNWCEENTEPWIAHYRREGLERFATGAVVLRRSGRERVVALDADDAPAGSGSDQLMRIFAALDFDGDLSDERLALAPHRLHEQLAWTSAGYVPEHLGLSLDDGLGIEARVEPDALTALFALDGSRPLRELPGAVAALPTIRRLFELGFVERL